jgi:hypothetical protein
MTILDYVAEQDDVLANAPYDLENAWPMDLNRYSPHPSIVRLSAALVDRVQGTQAWANATGSRDFAVSLTVLSLNLWHNARAGQWTIVSKDSGYYTIPSRYLPAQTTYKPLRRVLDALEEAGLVEVRSGFRNHFAGMGYRSRVWPSQEFLRLFAEHGVPVETAERRVYGEPIVLKRGKKLSDYAETDETQAFRGFVDGYNAFIGQYHVGLPEGFRSERPLDYSRKRTYRVFNHGCFDLGGRFYGPWWQSASTADRAHILIDGETTVECDYQAIQVHLLWSLEGRNYHDVHGRESDPYVVSTPE